MDLFSKSYLLAGLMTTCVTGCRAVDPGEPVGCVELRQLFATARSDLDGEYAQAHVNQLLGFARQLGPKQFALQLSRQEKPTRYAVLQWLLPVVRKQPAQRELSEELEKLAAD